MLGLKAYAGMHNLFITLCLRGKEQGDTQMHVHTCIHMYIHTCMYTYAHTQMHVHTCTPYGKIVEWNQLSGSLVNTQADI